MVIKSAVIPVAGHGTRLLPATKSQPKEMLPVARKPIVQYVVEELVANGIEQILFVTGRNKASIENHFDTDPELARVLAQNHQHELLQELDFEALRANFFYTRQRLQKGLGDAILCGENFAGEEPFLLALGDSIIWACNADASRAVTPHDADVFESKRHASCVIAVEEVPAGRDQRTTASCSRRARPTTFSASSTWWRNRKPEEAPKQRLAIAGRYIFSPVIFDKIRMRPAG